MKSQLTLIPEALTSCTFYNHCDYYLTLLVFNEHLNILKYDLALMATYSYNLQLAVRRGLATLQSLVPF
jgi:hypothetical protein